jgi:hypothetical protein
MPTTLDVTRGHVILKVKEVFVFKSFDFQKPRNKGVEGPCLQLCTMLSSTHWWDNQPKPCNNACKFKMYVTLVYKWCYHHIVGVMINVPKVGTWDALTWLLDKVFEGDWICLWCICK